MRFKGRDLNLVVALDALMTGVTSRAAARNLSQPAMSAAAARLRAYSQDEQLL